MTTIRKLSQFRQLSLTCETTPPSQRRKSLKKQFSEDIPDFKTAWFNSESEIKVSLNSKTKKDPTNKPPPIKIAWSGTRSPDVGSEDAVIIKKYKELGRPPSRKLTRHGSLEKDSILYSKQDLTENLYIEAGKDEKPNLKIFLAHNTKEYENEYNTSQTEVNDQYLDKSYDINKPKLKQPLVTNIADKNSFQIRKNKVKSSNEPLCSPKAHTETNRSMFTRSNTVVVIPIVEADNNPPPCKKTSNNNNPPDINIVIRPATAASRREKFQKRTNSAFHSIDNTTVKDTVANTNSNNSNASFRPPLIRSSSAPASRTEKGKFLATKRKIKGSKRSHSKSKEFGSNLRTGCDQTEWNNASPHSNDIETMVSLVSPSGSENEEASEDEKEKEKPKPVLKQASTPYTDKTVLKEESAKEPVKGMTLRKAVKSVTFQQSSIHAIRSFSASFPARRGSMATTLNLHNNNGGGSAKTSAAITPTKVQEKRATNSSTPDADERVPKRRLVRSNTTDNSKNSVDKPDDVQNDRHKAAKLDIGSMKISVDIQSKNQKQIRRSASVDLEKQEYKEKQEENVTIERNSSVEEAENSNEIVEDLPQYKTPKEKQCWDMYCKMTKKGIDVSYETILRGMLTPTEYRMRRKSSIAEEMKLTMANDSKLTEMQGTNYEGSTQ